MTSRCVHAWKFVKSEKGEMERAIGSRSVLRGNVGLEAFDVETFSGTARRSSQRLLASAAARRKQRAIASVGINAASLKELAYQGLAEATGEKQRVACFALPP
eukprot:1212314-Pyramimonas_sp.AAC.1